MNTAHLVRASDPLSSVLAAEGAPKFAGSLQIYPEQGATAHEIGAEAGLTVVQVDRRMKTLADTGRIRVLQHDDGADVMRGGFRCWTLVRG